MTIQSDDRIVVQAPAWRRLLLRMNGPMVAGDILIPGNERVQAMRRLQHAARRRTRG